MSNNFSYKDLEPAIREKLASGGRVRIMPNGTSMLPMIRQGLDEVELTATNGRLKKYDIAFYKRGSGQFVLHRIIKVRKNDYVFCGDNQTEIEKGIKETDIIAAVAAVFRGDKRKNANGFFLRVYGYLMTVHFCKRLSLFARRAVAKLRKKR